MRRQAVALQGATLTLLALTLAACSGSSVNAEPGFSATATRPATSTATPGPTSTIDPKARAAVKAYESFQAATINAQRKPVASGQGWPDGGDFTRFSFDPIKTAYVSYIWSLESQGVEFRGTPDTQHISVAAIDLKASPWPTVTLKDCRTGGDWEEYSIKTGKKIPLAGNGDVPPPYLITAKIIFYKNHWGVHSTTADKSRTCTA